MGAGAWGTALAKVLADAGNNVTLWVRRPELADEIAAGGEKLKYEVHDIRVVEPADTSSLHREPGQDLVTLITCTPYGVNTHRLLVTGHRVPMDPEDEAAFNSSGIHWQWWMWAILAAAAIIVLLLIYWWRKYVSDTKDAVLDDDPQDS